MSRLAAAVVVFGAMSPSRALADSCDVDLISATEADVAVDFTLFAGEVVEAGVPTGEIAVCLASGTGSAAGAPELVAWLGRDRGAPA